MKKVYTTIILFVSLFFFCSHNVSAATYEYTLSEESMALINDDFYKVRGYALEYCNTNGGYYYIFYQYEEYKILFFKNKYALSFNIYSSNISLSLSTEEAPVYVFRDNNIKENLKRYNHNFTFNILENIINLNTMLDTNYDFIYKLTDDISISYMDYTYTINSDSVFPSVYHFYLNTIGKPDIHEGEKEILSNFYTLVIEKINLLANSIINNYIYLTVIGIFILIFVICLIRRYLL